MANGVYGKAITAKAKLTEMDREVTSYEDEVIPDVKIQCKGELAGPDHSTWYMGITREDFLEIYEGTSISADIRVFDSYPENDDEMLETYLPSKLWRLNNLYFIINKDGYKMQFLMNYAQHVVYAASLRHPRIIILKSRQQRH